MVNFIPMDTSDDITGPTVADALDKLWSEKVVQESNFRAEPTANPKERAHQWDDNLCKSVLEIADKVLPKRRAKKFPRRDVSSRTRALFTKRSRMTKSNSSKQQFKKIQSQIKGLMSAGLPGMG